MSILPSFLHLNAKNKANIVTNTDTIYTIGDCS
jgi:hypothetical protein